MIELDAAYRAARTRCDELRNRRNVISKQIGGMMARGERDAAEAAKAEVKAMADEMAALSEQETSYEAEIHKRMPRDPEPDRPGGAHRPRRHGKRRARALWRAARGRTIPCRYHVDIMRALGGIDLDSARKTSGNGFYYLMGDVARLHSAVLSYARDFMIDRGFTYCIPPYMIRGGVVDGVMSFSEMENMMYKIEGEDLYLIGTSEHSMIGKFIDTILDEAGLPQTLTSYSPCFRKEVGATASRSAASTASPV